MNDLNIFGSFCAIKRRVAAGVGEPVASRHQFEAFNLAT